MHLSDEWSLRDVEKLSIQNGIFCGYDDYSTVWLSFPDGKEIASLERARSGEHMYWPDLRVAALSPNRKLIATPTSENTIELWKAMPMGRRLLSLFLGDEKDAEPLLGIVQPTPVLLATIKLVPPAKPGTSPDWLVYTPDGYFDGSASAIEKIRWRQGDKLLPGNAFPQRHKPGLLSQLAK